MAQCGHLGSQQPCLWETLGHYLTDTDHWDRDTGRRVGSLLSLDLWLTALSALVHLFPGRLR